MQLELVPILATRLRYLHQLQIWPPDGATRNGHRLCIESITCIESIICITCIMCTTCTTSVCQRHSDPQIGPQVYLGPIKMCVQSVVSTYCWIKQLHLSSVYRVNLIVFLGCPLAQKTERLPKGAPLLLLELNGCKLYS